MEEYISISDTKIIWKRKTYKYGKELIYESLALNHGEYVSITKQLIIDGKTEDIDLVHIPLEVIDLIKNLKIVK